MSEMLANHYFHVRNYAAAQDLYEQILVQKSADKPIRRRLVICYIQTGAIRKALDIFVNLVLEDVEFIINTHPVDDDCPCPELVMESEKFDDGSMSLDMLLRFGMLWLYCNVQKSLSYFEQALRMDPEKREIKLVLSYLYPKLTIPVNRSTMERSREAFR